MIVPDIIRMVQKEHEGAARKLDLNTTTISQVPFSGTVAGVDGGISIKKIPGVTLVLLRAVSTVMKYDAGELKRTEYIGMGEPVVIADELDVPGLHRLRKESSRALEACQRADMILLDGSLVLQPQDKPASTARKLYKEVMAKYTALYQESLDSGKVLAGVVEDSRASTLTGKNDTLVLSYKLKPGEMTESFEYSKHSREHPVLSDLPEEHAKRIRFFYYRPNNDLPIRVEYYDNGKFRPEDLAAWLTSLAVSPDYGIPAPIIEADLRAKIKIKEAEGYWASMGLKPRRERRPFR